MELENALEIAGRLRAALATEVESARRERQLLRSLDARGLFARAAERTEFLGDVARLERDLASALSAAASTAGLQEVTLEALRARAPASGDQLASTLSDVRALAGALQEIDKLNLLLAGRALACVRGYTEALRPSPSAYDRRGARSAAAAPASISTKG